MNEIEDQSRMNTKDRFDALMNLANFYREIRQARISREWRVTFGIWTVLATVAISAATIKTVPYWLTVVFAVSAILFQGYWLRRHFRLHENEAKRMYKYRDDAAQLLIPNEVPPLRKGNAKFVPFAEWFITLFLAIIALIANRPR